MTVMKDNRNRLKRATPYLSDATTTREVRRVARLSRDVAAGSGIAIRLQCQRCYGRSAVYGCRRPCCRGLTY